MKEVETLTNQPKQAHNAAKYLHDKDLDEEIRVRSI